MSGYMLQLQDEIRRLTVELDEQCRINGMGAERELKLKTQLREATNIIGMIVDVADRLMDDLGHTYSGYMFDAVMEARLTLKRWGKV